MERIRSTNEMEAAWTGLSSGTFWLWLQDRFGFGFRNVLALAEAAWTELEPQMKWRPPGLTWLQERFGFGFRNVLVLAEGSWLELAPQMKWRPPGLN